MDFTEFRRRLGAEPRSDDESLGEAARSGPEFREAAEAAAALEDRIESTLRFDVDSQALLEPLLQIPGRDGARAGPQRRRWLALAASVIVMIGAATWMTLNLGRPASLEDYVVSHYQHDGARVLSRAEPGFDSTEVNRIMARFGAEAAPALSNQVSYIKICPSLHARGAHMVLATNQGPVTVIYMPDTRVSDPLLMQFDGVQAEVITLLDGSAAVISPAGQSVESVHALLRDGLQAAPVDA